LIVGAYLALPILLLIFGGSSMRRVNNAPILFSAILAILVATLPDVAFAQSALSNGVNHIAVLQVGGLGTWTFTATKNDGITVSVGKVLGGESDSFGPWIRLKGPDGSLLRESYTVYTSENSVQVDQQAPLTGTYTVLVANRYPNQVSPAGYVLTLAKTPAHTPYLQAMKVAL
jgi:hypothetical protein